MPAAKRQSRQPRMRMAAPAPLLDLASRPEAPGADLIAAVLTHADLETRLGPQRVRRSLSPYRAAELREAGRLNASEAARSLDISVIWNEAEAEVVRVVDDAPLRCKTQSSRAWWEDAWEEELWQAPTPRPALRSVKGGRP
ncbi:hypothetical protein [Phenylobacterium sp.]|uniref:hypothetical protein n=1 Tax=Phenylobacterium sp. TaxID=1871053 RepID=UPI00272F6353|nr:hypothetical protein [Phenylobacterium sp.]MDP1618977.1 hypothetical protein [Phenylobacterium sp.]MDP1989307.1 hypothetical protein [Phenylobacterium sp.]